MFVPEISLQAENNQVISQLREACHTYGFFYLVDHGIPDQQIEAVLNAMPAFFQQPLETKKGLERSDINPWGYYDNELTKNRKDWKEILDIGPDGKTTSAARDPFPHAKAQWPEQPAQFKPQMQAYMASCASLGERLRRLLLQSLGCNNPEQEAPFGEDHSSFLRLNYYPLCADPAPADADFVPSKGELGISHHTDAGALTLLLQGDVAGLQFYHQQRWHTIQPKPGTLMVNIGDVVQVWSNDRYPAPLHRVLASATQERYSAAYFYNPSYAAHYAPLPNTGEPSYRPISWAEFRTGRTEGDYANLGEEVQISHYRR